MRNLILSAVYLWCASCGGSTSGMGGPTMNGSLQDNSTPTSSIESEDILARDAQAKKVGVKHVLVGWKKASEASQDPRATKRDRTDADALASDILKRCNAGEDIDKLMADYSEDPGSAKSARVYDVTADAKLVFEFKRLSLRLKVDECGVVETQFGWHIIKRVE